jgi:hypothetical protein
MRTAQDVLRFPAWHVGQPGAVSVPVPMLMGIPVLVSGNVPTVAGRRSLRRSPCLSNPELTVADDGQVTVDTSNEASLQLDTAPATPPTPLISLWQQNMLGIRAERYIYWLMRRVAAVQEITGFHP